MKSFFRKHRFINPINLYSYHRRKIIEDFPAQLPPIEDDENILTTTQYRALAIRYRTEPMKTEEREKSA